MAEDIGQENTTKNVPPDPNIDKILKHVKNIISSSQANSNDILQAQKTIETSDHNHHVNENDNNTECNGNEHTLLSLRNGEFELTELLLIVNEFEKLRDKYLSLEKDVETINNKDSNTTEVSNVNQLNEEIISLKAENERLNKVIEELTSKDKQKDLSENDLNEALQKTISRLELEVKDHKKLANVAAEKLTAHDAAAKRAITVLQKEMGSRIDQVQKMYQESVSEKDAYIIKISKLEQLLDELQQNKNSQNKKISENQLELENLRSVLKNKDSDYIKLVAANELLEKDGSKLKKKIETHTNDGDAQDMKVKWAQNKLKAETDAHKETKKQITQLTAKLQEAKEEGDQIRRNCQEMIERYQGDEEINSIRLNKELEEQTNKMKLCQSEIAKQDQFNKQKEKDLKSLKEEHDQLTKELFDERTKITILEGKNMNLTNDIIEREKDCTEYKTTVESLKDEVKNLQDVKVKVIEYEEEVKNLKESDIKLHQQISEYEMELGEHKNNQQEILLYSQSLTENNASSKAMATDLQTKLDFLLIEKAEVCEKLRLSGKEYNGKVEKLKSEKINLETKIEDMSDKLEQKSNTINELSASLEDAQDQLKVLKKKNVSQMKDLQRQLHQTTRKIEQMESNSKNGSMENLSIRSRTSSNNSLEKQTDSPPNFSSSPQMPHEPVLIPQDHNIIQPNTRNQYQEIEVDKKVLVDRICKLQRLHAKKNEKIEFMEEHINHLTEDLQKKAKIIQFYVYREEAGSLASDKFDRNKADVSQHGGIMASVYSARSHDKTMTLELSLTINRKLQAVLEDTILKNIMLKENINTLGIEIARLQDELKAAKES